MHSHPDPVIRRQLPTIAKIIQDETWLEGERRRQPVSPNDPAVRENVCQVILRVGQDLRDRAIAGTTGAAAAAGSDPQASAA
jgi:hypothetical protein